MEEEKPKQPSKEQLLQAQLYAIQCGIPWRIPKEERDRIIAKMREEEKKDSGE